MARNKKSRRRVAMRSSRLQEFAHRSLYPAAPSPSTADRARTHEQAEPGIEPGSRAWRAGGPTAGLRQPNFGEAEHLKHGRVLPLYLAPARGRRARLSCSMGLQHTAAAGLAGIIISRAHGVVVSHPLSMREALGSIPSVSIVLPCHVGRSDH